MLIIFFAYQMPHCTTTKKRIKCNRPMCISIDFDGKCNLKLGKLLSSKVMYIKSCSTRLQNFTDVCCIVGVGGANF